MLDALMDPLGLLDTADDEVIEDDPELIVDEDDEPALHAAHSTDDSEADEVSLDDDEAMDDD